MEQTSLPVGHRLAGGEGRAQDGSSSVGEHPLGTPRRVGTALPAIPGGGTFIAEGRVESPYYRPQVGPTVGMGIGPRRSRPRIGPMRTIKRRTKMFFNNHSLSARGWIGMTVGMVAVWTLAITGIMLLMRSLSGTKPAGWGGGLPPVLSCRSATVAAPAHSTATSSMPSGRRASQAI